MRMSVLAVLLLGLAGAASAKPWWMRGVESNENDFLDPNVAFRASAAVDGNLVRVRWVIADGYYLYRQKIDIRAESPDLEVTAPALPQGALKTDPYLGTQEIYRQQVEATVTYTRLDAGAHPMEIKVTYQGCADAGLCYPPITKVLLPGHAAPTAAPAQHPWEGVAILGGGFAFLFAGLLLRKGRNLDLPAA
jgi:thiol:disulfide interchange protein DsbD